MTHDYTRVVDALRTSLKERDELGRELSALRGREEDPIAIVSMACRYPGGIDTPEALWDAVRDGEDLTTSLPEDRGWDVDALVDPTGERPGTSMTDRGGFLTGAGEFDAGFFNMSPHEAKATDPQHRVLLETAWEAFERAGMSAEELAGSSTGVYIGSAYQGYGQDWYEAPAALQGPLVAGMSTSIMSGRIAYHLGLRGPAVTIDTACSSSLVAIHHAIAGLRRGDCDAALAGGAAIMAAPIALVGFSRQRGVAADGRCKAFGESADGMGLGEGAGVVLLERLSRARSLGHPVLAVIEGSAINQDGASNGISAPNGAAQVDVIREGLESARLAPDDIDLVETHGTGTRLGDPIEANALIEAYGTDRSGQALQIGSLKSNIGHAQAASGVGGLMKLVGALTHGWMPRTLHADPVTPLIDWEGSGVEVLTQGREWTAQDGQPRRGAVSSFGLSGTNAHLIVSQAPAEAAVQDPAEVTTQAPTQAQAEAPVQGAVTAAAQTGPSSPVAVLGADAPVVWVLSARSPKALASQAQRLADRVRSAPQLRTEDIAHSLLRTRTHHEHRAVVLGRTRDDLLDGLAQIARGAEATPAVVRGRTGADGATALLFPGQGSQSAGMGRELLEESPVFRARMEECARALAPHLGVDVIDLLLGEDESWLERVELVQPALWAVMVSLSELWRRCGLDAAAVVGHSQGEIAAAVVSGALSVEDGAAVVALRARALTRIAGTGGMLAVRADPARVRQLVDVDDVRLSLAVHNGAGAAVLAGGDEALDEAAAALEAAGVDARLVSVDYPSHSPVVERLRDELADALGGVSPDEAEIPMYSTVTGEVLTGHELTGDYWFGNLRRTVRMADAVAALRGDGITRAIECSPHPVLVSAIDIEARGTLRRDDAGVAGFLRALCGAWADGADVDLGAVIGQGRTVDLPTYAFDRTHHWLPSRSTARDAAAEADLAYTIHWVDIPLSAPARADGREAADIPSPVVLHVPGTVDEESFTALDSAFGSPVTRVPVDPDADRTTLGTIVDDLDPAAVLLSLLPHADAPRGGAGGTVGLSTTLALLQVTAGRHVWHLTREAAAVREGERVSAEQAAVAGLVRIGRTESAVTGGLIDLGTAEDAVVLPALIAAGAEDQWAVRDGRTLGRRLGRARRTTAEWTPRGTLLLVGGTRGVGAQIARWAVGTDISRLVLLTRRAPQDDLLAELREHCPVDVEIADVTDRDRVIDAVAGIEDLRTVIHTAGALDDALIDSLTPERVDTALAPKAQAVEHLSEAVGDRPLDAFIVFSSMAGVLGGPGQGGYAAANAHLDAWAQDRRARSLPATSLAWGLLDAGSLADDGARERLAATGSAPVSADAMIDQMRRAVASGDAVRVIADVEWARLAESADGVLTDTLADLVPAQQDDAASAAADQWDAEALHDLVARSVAGILGYDSAADVDSGRALRDLGFDSVTVMDLRRRIADATGLSLPVAALFDHPSVDALSLRLAQELGAAEPEEDAAATAEPPVRASTAPATPGAAADGTVTVTDHDPLAIVGIAVRLPGGVESPSQMWDVLREGRDLVGPLPRDRGWDLSRFDPDPDTPGTFYAEGGGFLDDVAGFDADFFGISPREAVSIDPQQRLLLEATWETIEAAGMTPEDVRGTRTGVFLGASYNDYGSRSVRPGSEHEGYLALGSSASVASGRLSYTFGLEGPALTVDTACSSSLVALQLASEAVRSGGCERALVGGVAIMSTLSTFIEFSRQRAMSPDGRCKAFSDGADGAGWAEGIGMIMVEPLSAARAAGREVLAVVEGIAANQDGASNGLTAPNGAAQQKVIRQAHRNAGITAADVDAIEAHGTGTRLGDPIEADALTSVYGGDRTRPLPLGSLKSNTGHTQAAAGILSLIKMVLALRHDWIPESLHADTPSSYIDWASTPLEVSAGAAWPRASDRRRFAGVSAFGISGTNVHVVVGDPPMLDAPATTASAAGQEPRAADGDGPSVTGPSVTGPVPIPLVGRSDRHLRSTAAALARQAQSEGFDVRAAARGLGSRTGIGPHRALLIAQDAQAVAHAADALAAGAEDEAVVTEPHAAAGADAPVTWVFSGQGSQLAGMGEDLRRLPAFAEELDAVIAGFDGLLDVDLRRVMREGDGIDRTSRSQPALFALQTALARTLVGLGMRPASVVGHSIGEYAALHVAGVLSLRDACRLVAARGRLMEDLPSDGTMLSVRARRDELEELLSADPDVVVAVINTEESLVLSGPTTAIREMADVLTGRGVRVRPLSVSHAFHSPLMDPMLAPFAEVAAGLSPAAPSVPVISTVTGEPLDVVDADYLVRQVREPVRFSDAVTRAHADGARVFLEVGPRAVLSSQIAHVLDGEEPPVVAPLQQEDRDGVRSLLRGVGAAFAAGAAVDFTPWWGEGPALRPEHSPFDRGHYWLDEDTSASDPGALGLVPVDGPLLRARVDLEGTTVLTGALDTDGMPWVGEHVVGGRAILPATGLLEIALEAGRAIGRGRVEELAISAPVVVPAGQQVPVRAVVTWEGDDVALQIVTGSDDDSTVHAAGRLTRPQGTGFGTVPDADLEAVDGLYERMDDNGFSYGPSYRGLQEVGPVRRGEGVVAHARLPESVGADAFILHPALLDAALHALAFVELEGMAAGMVPFVFTGVEVGEGEDGARQLRVRIAPTGGDRVRVDLFDGSGVLAGTLESLTLRPAQALVRGGGGSANRVGWETVPWPQAPQTGIPQVRRGAEDPVALPDTGIVRLHLEPSTAQDPATAATAAVGTVLPWVQALAEAESPVRLLVVTRGAAAERPDVGHAAAVGLVRSAQNEHPGRFALVDADAESEGEGIEDALWPALAALTEEEPEVRVLRGEPQVRRVVRTALTPREEEVPRVPLRTTLITGASGLIGRAVAVHLAETGETDGLVLASRRGRTRELDELADRLKSAGVTVRLVSADVTDEASVRALFDEAAAAGAPITDILHTAGVLDDAVTTELSEERIAPVLRTKLAGAANLLAAADRGVLRSVVLFSSVAGVLGGAGQGSYAAANAGLDALARLWNREGVPAQSQAWGVWAETSGMTDGITRAGRSRVQRSGIEEMETPRALALFDRLRDAADPEVVAAEFDRSALARLEREGQLLSALRGLVPASEAQSTRTWADDMVRLAPEDRAVAVLQAVRSSAARVLGLEASSLPVDRGLLDAGFDSLTAVELRNQLAARAGIALPATLLFDYPTVTEIADHLDERLPAADPRATGTAETAGTAGTNGAARTGGTSAGGQTAATAAVSPDEAFQTLDTWLTSVVDLDDSMRGRVANLVTRLDALLSDGESEDELFAAIEKELGEV